MIDRFGNKIKSSADEKLDLDFLKDEIIFLMKGFQKDPTDTKARLMAIKGEKLSANLQGRLFAHSDLRLLDQLITAMTEHCQTSRDRDIPWYMAWLCRNLHREKRITAANGYENTDFIALSCFFFERYEQVEPTNQGRNLLINTYCMRAAALMDANDPQKDAQALALLEKAKLREEKMDPEYSRHNRFSVCEQLYEYLYNLYTRMERPKDAFDALLQAIRCVKKGIAVKKESRGMRSLARFCCLYTQHSLYDPATDAIDLQSVILMLEEFHKKNILSGIRSYLVQLAAFKKP